MALGINEYLDNIREEMIGEKADEQTVSRRREICSSCPDRKSLTVLGLVLEVCGVCKCPIETKTAYKTHILQKINPLNGLNSENTETVKCPLEKW